MSDLTMPTPGDSEAFHDLVCAESEGAVMSAEEMARLTADPERWIRHLGVAVDDIERQLESSRAETDPEWATRARGARMHLLVRLADVRGLKKNVHQRRELSRQQARIKQLLDALRGVREASSPEVVEAICSAALDGLRPEGEAA